MQLWATMKCHPVGLKDFERREKETRMYETKDQNGGYKALKLYLQKVNPMYSAFFQYPKKTAELMMPFGTKQPVGINGLAKMMIKTISDEGHLSKIYKNHSVRATAIALWSNDGISKRHIMAISKSSWPSHSQLHNCS